MKHVCLYDLVIRRLTADHLDSLENSKLCKLQKYTFYSRILFLDNDSMKYFNITCHCRNHKLFGKAIKQRPWFQIIFMKLFGRKLFICQLK